MNDYSEFLKSVEGLNEKYASIFINCELEPLVMPFWSWREIQNSLGMRQDWEVADNLIPFYGDWHDLFCLNEDTGEVIALDDNREVVCRWASIDDFMSCLSEKEVLFNDQAGISLSSPFPNTRPNSRKKH